MKILGETSYIYTPMMIIFKNIDVDIVVPRIKENNFISSKNFFILLF
jgi:hypothetical protein